MKTKREAFKDGLVYSIEVVELLYSLGERVKKLINLFKEGT